VDARGSMTATRSVWCATRRATSRTRCRPEISLSAAWWWNPNKGAYTLHSERNDL